MRLALSDFMQGTWCSVSILLISVTLTSSLASASICKSIAYMCYSSISCFNAAALYLLLGRPMLPPGEGWALFLLWVCAHIGGFTANKVNLPPLLGMLVAGVILRNIPQGETFCCQ